MRGRRQKKEVDTELNITTFLNLMVVLIPFLLLSAAFTQIGKLDLVLPTAGKDNPLELNKEPKPVLEIMIADKFLVIGNRQQTKALPAGVLKVIEKKGNAHDFDALNRTLSTIKDRFSDVEDITILLEEETPYDHLIQTMDSVRIEIDDSGNEFELFPNIAIGDAPVDAVKELNVKFGYGS
jgi:biopolymer transport protein ExbD